MRECNTVSFEGQEIFVGIDVHEKSWYVALRHCHRELEIFCMNPSPEELAEHLKRKYPGAGYQSVYEAGFSGFWAHHQLCELGVKNIVINPADIPTSGKEKARKNDRGDSRKLARELESGSLEAIYIPSPENLELRCVVRRETQIVRNITRVKNRIHGHLHFLGLKFVGWAARSIKVMTIAAEERDDAALLSMFRELRFLREEKLRVVREERRMLRKLNRENIQTCLQSIPGIGFRTGITLHAEFWDMSRFTQETLASYTGFAPCLVGSGEHETVRSPGKRKKKELHYLLIEAAWRAIGNNPELRARYGALVQKGSSQRAISIVAKKLLFSIRAIWLQQRMYEVAKAE